MATETVYVLDEASLRFLRREIRRHMQAALHQLAGQAGRTWRPGGGGEGTELIPFELKYKLEPGGDSEAYPLKWDDAEKKYKIVPAATFPIVDPIGKFRGYGRHDGDGGSENPAIDGFRGLCARGGDGFGIVYLQTGVTMFTAKLEESETVTPSTTELTIDTDTIKIWQPTDKAPWYTPDMKPPETVYNSLQISAADSIVLGMFVAWRKDVSSIPAGWGHMDGAANADAYDDGETPINLVNQFIRGRDGSDAMDNLSLGTEEHQHSIQTATTGITAAADETCISPSITQATAAGAGDVWGFDGATGAALCHEHTVTVTDPGHAHSEDTQDHLPPYKRPHFIEPTDDRTRDLLLCVWNDSQERYEAIMLCGSDTYDSEAADDEAIEDEEPGAGDGEDAGDADAAGEPFEIIFP